MMIFVVHLFQAIVWCIFIAKYSVRLSIVVVTYDTLHVFSQV